MEQSLSAQFAENPREAPPRLQGSLSMPNLTPYSKGKGHNRRASRLNMINQQLRSTDDSKKNISKRASVASLLSPRAADSTPYKVWSTKGAVAPDERYQSLLKPKKRKSRMPPMVKMRSNLVRSSTFNGSSSVGEEETDKIPKNRATNSPLAPITPQKFERVNESSDAHAISRGSEKGRSTHFSASNSTDKLSQMHGRTPDSTYSPVTSVQQWTPKKSFFEKPQRSTATYGGVTKRLVSAASSPNILPGSTGTITRSRSQIYSYKTTNGYT